MYKSLVSGGLALLAAFALQPAIAQAHTQIGTTIGTTVGEDWSPAQYYPGYPDYDDEDNYEKKNDIHNIQVIYYIYIINIKYKCINQYFNSTISKFFHSISDK